MQGVYFDSEVAWRELIKALKTAKESIAISAWFLYESSLSTEFLQVLKERGEAGVKITIKYYAGLPAKFAGFINGVVNIAGKPMSFTDIKNLTLIEYGKGTVYGMHQKLIVIDTKYVIASDRNIADDYYGKQPAFTGSDNHLVDAKVATLIYAHIVDISERKIDAIETKTDQMTKIDFLVNEPKKDFDNIINRYIQVIKQSKRIYFVNCMFDLPKEIIDALNTAIKDNNAEVTCVTNYVDYVNANIKASTTRSLAYNSVKQLSKYKLYGYNNKNTLHNKYMLVELTNGTWQLIFGSFNMDFYSIHVNTEYILHFETPDEKTVQTYSFYTQALIDNSLEIKSECCCNFFYRFCCCVCKCCY